MILSSLLPKIASIVGTTVAGFIIAFIVVKGFRLLRSSISKEGSQVSPETRKLNSMDWGTIIFLTVLSCIRGFFM